MSTADARLLYVGDPMCSWCWGFAPELKRTAEHFELPVDVIVGGLRPGPNAQLLDERLSGFLRKEWTRIHEATGQPFSFASLDWEGWIYDTEVPAAAVALARKLGNSSVLHFMSRIQHAFYADAVDITRGEAYADLWTAEEETGVSAAAFVEQLATPESRQLAYDDFGRARDLGIRGFPALIFQRTGPQPIQRMIAHGYQPSDQMAPVIERLLS